MLKYTLLTVILAGATWQYLLLSILSVLICLALVFIIMVQNPKGGGLSSSFGGGNQVLGARKTSDFLEKSTWALAIILVSITLLSSFFIEKDTSNVEPVKTEVIDDQDLENINMV